MSRLTILNTSILGLQIVEREEIKDDRGFFSRLFCSNELTSAGWNLPIVQINQSFTKYTGTVRGMHWQAPPDTEIKLVTCLHGAICDVAVDLRAESPTFLQWYSAELSAENRRGLLIPERFAHGFQTLSNDCLLLYVHTKAYAPKSEKGFNLKDPQVSIKWPLSITDISAKDAKLPMIDRQFKGVAL
jgi:dTDP-4-dehydrorhamnose 3,5-epimerase